MAELARIDGAVAAELPRLYARREGRAGHVGRIEIEGEVVTMHLVELSVDHHPAPLGRSPIFANPMVLIGVRGEVAAIAAPHARRHAVLAQHTAQHQREVAAGAQRPRRARPRDAERERIDRENLLQASRNRQGLAALAREILKVQPMLPDPRLMDQQPLQRAAQRRNVRRQAFDQCRVGAWIGEGAVSGVMVERCVFGHGCTGGGSVMDARDEPGHDERSARSAHGRTLSGHPRR